MKYLLINILILSILLVSCNNIGTETPDNTIASYSGSYLLLSDLENQMPESLTIDDSLKWIGDVRKQWLKNQIIIEKAEKELPKTESNITLDILQ